MKKISTLMRGAACGLAALAALALHPTPATAQAPAKVTIVIFGFPSLGAFMPPVIKAKKLDEANGLDIEFVERPPDAYTTQFNSGEFKVGGSAALLTVGVADERGVKVKYLFNLFDFWGAVVTSRPEIKTAPPGLVGYAVADRADAVQLWEPAYTLLKAKKPDIRALDLGMQKTWSGFAGGAQIPYRGLAAHTDWIEQNPALVQKLYATYRAAGDYIVKHPEESAGLMAPKATPDAKAALVSLIKANDRLGMNVVGAHGIKQQIEAVYKAGVDVGYLKKMPSSDTIYDKIG